MASRASRGVAIFVCYEKPPRSKNRGLCFVRPAWAQSWRCKSSRELTTANEAKRNCVRVTERGEEAWSETAGRRTETGYQATPGRASGQETAKLSWSKPRRRKSGGRAGKDCVLTWGDPASRLKGRRGDTEREVSRGHSSRTYGEGPKEQEGVSSGSRDRIASDVCVSEARRSSCPGEARTDAAARNRYRRIGDRQPREARRDNTNAPTSTVSTARCGPACRVVWEGSGHHDRPLSRLKRA
jgi:hypothetical protein